VHTAHPHNGHDFLGDTLYHGSDLRYLTPDPNRHAHHGSNASHRGRTDELPPQRCLDILRDVDGHLDLFQRRPDMLHTRG
jgi:hypothetical protein